MQTLAADNSGNLKTVASHRIPNSAFSKIIKSLHSFFAQIWSGTSPSTSPFLTAHSIRVGGIQNAGNSCVFSVLIQDLAAEPEFYDSMLTCVLHKEGEETYDQFQNRKQLQAHLKHCVEKNRRGECIVASEIVALREYLQKSGWDGATRSWWTRLLHCIAPFLFPLPQVSPFQVYKTLCILLKEPSTVLQGTYNPEIPLTEYLNRMHLPHQANRTLLRVQIIGRQLQNLPTKVKSNGSVFTLRQIHVLKDRHVFLFKKVFSKWIYCNDNRIQLATHLPKNGTYLLIYKAIRNDKENLLARELQPV